MSNAASIADRIAAVQAEILDLHERSDATSRAVQYEIACKQLKILDMRLGACTTEHGRKDLHKSRALIAADVTRLLKQESKDRYLTILDRFDAIDKAKVSIAHLAKKQQ